MADEPAVTLREHMDALLGDLTKEVQRGQREFGHRLDELKRQNAEDHNRVLDAMHDLSVMSHAHETRLDLLESERDVRIGERNVKNTLAKYGMPVLYALAGGGLSAIAGFFT